MVFVACGLNHKTAPIAVREKIAASMAMQSELLNQLVNLPTINEVVVLSTCNRTEFYCDVQDCDELITWLTRRCQFITNTLSPYLYSLYGNQGIRHLLCVASGLDSMMLGEPQILGQMKQAYLKACQAGTIKTNLRNIFEYIFSASKRIRHRSGIGNNPVSIAYGAVQLIGQLFKNYAPLRVLLIGSGETATLVAKYLHKQGVRQFYVASRTSENAKLLATMFNGQALTISDIPTYLSKADVIISATACPLPFINKNLVTHALNQRDNSPMFFLDLAMPRDIEANVGELEQVKLYNIDDLQFLIDKGMDERRDAALRAEQLIDCELNNYIRWHRSLRAKDAICNYRQQMHTLGQKELKRAQAKLLAGFNQDEVLQELCDRLVNKLSHKPTHGLKQAVKDGREDLLDLTHYLFNQTSDSIPL
jgi:glutamyl-tRNA reductase